MSQLERFSDKDTRINRDFYQYQLEVKQPDGWRLQEKFRNFEDLLRITKLIGLPIRGASCLDVGCGSGRLAGYLREREVGRYLGVDIFEPSLAIARRMHPWAEFVHQDFLTFETDERFDFAFLSGAITVKIDSDHHALVRTMAAKMWQLTTTGFALNFLMPYDPPKESKALRKYTVGEIEELCREAVPDGAISNYRYPEMHQGNVYVFRSQPTSEPSSS